jgi:hypothetical protein
MTHPCSIALSYPLLSVILVGRIRILEAEVPEERVGQQLVAGQPFGRVFVDTFLKKNEVLTEQKENME